VCAVCQVAIKRVADVLSSPDQAKRALREICILRRMRHPNIIGLRDAFSKPSSTGAARCLHGRAVVQVVPATRGVLSSQLVVQ